MFPLIYSMDKDKIKDKIKETVKETVKEIFTTYLSQQGCRKTRERYEILDIIYSESKHFDMEALYEEMDKRNYRVSRATLYNTMQLLLECKLVLKHQFGNNLSCYERAYNNDFHYHLICTSCHNIQEYKDVEIEEIIQQKIKKFAPSHYSLYIFGTCSKCSAAQKRRKKKEDINKTNSLKTAGDNVRAAFKNGSTTKKSTKV